MIRCNPCNLTFSTRLLLSAHIRWVHKEKAGEFINIKVDSSDDEGEGKLFDCE